MMKKFKLLCAVLISCFVFCIPAFGQGEFSFSGIDGEWSGTLVYADYKDDTRVTIPIIAEIRSSGNGDALDIGLV